MRFHALCSLVAATAAMLPAVAADAAIDISLSPELQTVEVGDSVEVQIIATASGDTPEPFDAIDAIISWDPKFLTFTGSTQVNSQTKFFQAGFLPDPDGVNDDLGDGDAIFTALAFPGTTVFAPPAGAALQVNGLVITTLLFEAKQGTDNTLVSLLPEIGAFGSTRALLQGTKVTGTIGGPVKVVILVPLCPGEGSCFEANGTPACNNEECCNAVCDLDSFCCEVEWDETCKETANDVCGNCGSPDAGSCAEPHEGVGCNDAACCRIVCEADPFCCEVEWDGVCAAEGCTLCGGCLGDLEPNNQVDGADLGVLLANWDGEGCGDLNFDGTVDGSDLGILLALWGPCPVPFECPDSDHNCFSEGGPGCTDLECCEAVCTTDSFCCETSWDSLCVELASELCDGCGDLKAGDCCTDTGTPFCDDRTCCDLVCDLDPFCCDFAWDGLCAEQAAKFPECGCGGGPANDDCDGAIEIFDGDTDYSTLGATGSEPAWPCADGGSDIWYFYVATCTGTVTVSTCDQADYDTALEAFGGCDCSALESIGCNDDGAGCGGFTSFLSFDVVEGSCYLIRVGGFEGDSGSGTLTVVCQEGDVCGDPKAGDCCADNGTPGCDDLECCETVCAADSFCCDVEWDGICAGLAADLCPECTPVCGGPDAGDCCIDNGTPGCDDAACCDLICGMNPSCCDIAWDLTCADMAFTLCGSLCSDPVECEKGGDTPLSQSNDPVADAGQIACAAANITTENLFARSFDLSVGPTAGQDYQINCVDFGFSNSGSALLGSIDIYLDTNGGAPMAPGDDLQLLASSMVTLEGNFLGNLIAVFDPPVCVPADSVVVVVLNEPASADGFAVCGGNMAGTSAPTYILSASCAINTFVTYADIGFPDANWAMQILGDVGCGTGPKAVLINEIRIDQPGDDDDEYFELVGTGGASLDGLSYITIGDGDGGSGVVETVVDLTGQSIRENGYFVAAEESFSLGPFNLETTLNFENSDNVTHLLVSNFTGMVGDDLDTDDDCVLDITPWDEVLDIVSLVETPDEGDCFYGPPVGPDGTFVPAHIYRCVPDGTWTIGLFDPEGGDDTPKEENVACPKG